MEWFDYFITNKKRRRAIPWDEGVNVPPALRAVLVRSLQQLSTG